MAKDRFQFITNMSTRQKVTAGVFVVIVIVLLWQLPGLLGGGGDETITPSPTQIAATGPQATPVPAPLPKPEMSEREKALLQQQKEMEAKYIAAVNELQMLKLQRDIVETSKAIADAKLGLVTAQKNIVTLLEPPPPPSVAPGGYAQGLSGGPVSVVPGQEQAPPTTVKQTQEVSYTVVSISQLKSQWNAVLGYQTNLYRVSIGDTLPADGSTVISIDQSGVILEKDGTRKKVSLVPVI